MRLNDIKNVFYSPLGLAAFTGVTTKALQIAFAEVFRVQDSWKPLVTRVTQLPGGQLLLDWGPTIFASLAVLVKTLPKNTSPSNSDLPVQCYPKLDLQKIQETDQDHPRCWPSSLEVLGLSEVGKNIIDTNIRKACRSGSFSFEKKNLKYDTATVKLPISMTLVTNSDGTFEIILLSKQIFTTSGERTLRWAYNLTKGELLLKKRIVGVFEEIIIRHLHTKRAERGLITPKFIWRKITDKNGKNKVQLIEPVKEGTVSILFGKKPFKSFCNKYIIILDLLKDLKNMHTAHLEGSSTFEKNGEKVSFEVDAIFHSDIKPSNTLVFFKNGLWRAELCDFSNAGNPTLMTLSEGFTSPEYVRFLKQYFPDGLDQPSKATLKELIQFQLEYGVFRDLWAMGLVILSILVGREESYEREKEGKRLRIKISPLPCLKRHLKSSQGSTFKEEGILNMTQNEIDQDLAELQKEVHQMHPQDEYSIKACFCIVSNLLQIAPNQRSSMNAIINFMPN